MWLLLLTLFLSAVLIWWSYKLSRDVIKAIEAQNVLNDVLDTEYPVFSKMKLVGAYRNSVAASQKRQSVESMLLKDSAFEAAVRQRSIPEEVSIRMLEVAEAIVVAERAWYCHSVMLDANLSVLVGQRNRDDALSVAEQRLDVLSKDLFGQDADKLRDEWKGRLENASASDRDPSPRPYTNPWEGHARRFFPRSS